MSEEETAMERTAAGATSRAGQQQLWAVIRLNAVHHALPGLHAMETP